jgi:hypothetical protein
MVRAAHTPATHLQARTHFRARRLRRVPPYGRAIPTGWTEGDERQFERVKASYLARGRPAPKAAELAARLVNQRRRERGETRKDG